MHSSLRLTESLQPAASHSWCARAHRHSSRTTCQPVVRLAPAQAASQPLPALTSAESDTSNETTIPLPVKGQSHPTVKGISPVQLLSGSAGGPRVSATGAAAAAALNRQSESRPRWDTLLQCTLLAAAAVAAVPALLLLDTAEQAILGWDRLKQHASFAVAQARRQHPQQQQQSPLGVQRTARPLLPLWPPVLPIIVAVAPLGLLLLSQCRQACMAPAFLLGGSLLLQAYLNLHLTVLARVRGRATTAAPAAWAAAPTSRTAAAAAAAPPGAEAAAGDADRLPAAAVKLFAWLQVAGDLLRLVCCGWMAWVAVHATAVQAAGQPDHAIILRGALQRCFQPTDLGHIVAAATAAAVALQHLVQLWWGAACIVAVCCCSAAVYGLSAFAHCNVGR